MAARASTRTLCSCTKRLAFSRARTSAALGARARTCNDVHVQRAHGSLRIARVVLRDLSHFNVHSLGSTAFRSGHERASLLPAL
eukprot:2687419-Pleurochrysis_carterae.AAC.1